MSAKRRPHILSPKVSNTRPKRVIFIDTESHLFDINEYQQRHVFRLGHAIFCVSTKDEYLKPKDRLDFFHIDDFWDWALRRAVTSTTTYFVAHNWNYDLPILNGFEQLLLRDWQITGLYAKGTVGIFRFKQKNKRICFLDNGNFFSGELRQWGERLGYEKGVVDFSDNDDVILEYCRRDTEILYKLWVQWLSFLDEHRLGSFSLTVSSTAMTAFRTRFMKDTIWIHDNKEALELERASYHGGRTQVFYQGDISAPDYYNYKHASGFMRQLKQDNDPEEYYQLDINSMYPFVMRNNLYPTELMGVDSRCNLKRLKRLLADYCVIADVTVCVNDDIFPYKYKGHTTYPIGWMRLALTTRELEWCIRENWIHEIHKVAYYKRSDIFKEYVDYFYPLKAHYAEIGDKLYYTIVKLLQNGLYGKFGQTGINEIVLRHDPFNNKLVISNMHELEKHVAQSGDDFLYDTIPGYDASTGIRFEFIYIGGFILYREYVGESFHSFPAIASHVTADSRLYLQSLRLTAGKKNSYYCDTDSLWLNSNGYSNLSHLLDDSKLGFLKLEAQTQMLRIYASKDYELSGKIRRKGVSKHAEQIDASTFRQWQFPKIRGMIRSGNVSGVMIRRIEKHLQRLVYSGSLQPSGWIDPFYLPKYHWLDTEIPDTLKWRDLSRLRSLIRSYLYDPLVKAFRFPFHGN